MLTLAAIPSGCSTGGEDGSGDDGTGASETLTLRTPERVDTIAALLDRVPGDTTAISVVDIAAARRALGLPATADPTDDSGKISSPGYRLAEFTEPVLDGLADEVPSKRDAQAVDFGRVTAAVSLRTFEQNEMVMVLTPQPRREIEAALMRNPRQPVKAVAAGILLATGQANSEAPARALGSLDYVALGEGFVAVTDTLARARAVLAESGPARGFAVARRYLDSVRGEERAVTIADGIQVTRDDASCIRLIAGGGRLKAGSEDFVLLLNEAPDRTRFPAVVEATEDEDYRLARPRVDGSALRLKMTITGRYRESLSAAGAAGGGLPGSYYRCKGLPLRPQLSFRNRPPKDEPRPDPAGGNNYIAQKASRLIAIWSSARTRVRVNCPVDNSKPNSTIRCSGTRRDGDRQYRYAVTVTFDASRLAEIGAVAVTSSDDKTGTIMDYR